ncbi:NAD(P)-dependent oxidoreductase [Lysinibacillus sp. LZ02]|uniref:NAD(P)-dependent oxidoreductase n=1 Tax=Lysinibacillus sp. LZ02 TaxID=3420668 RepID=UPI003D36A62A
MDKTNTIAIIGGTGKVGRYIATKAVQSGYQVKMLVRNPGNLTPLESGIKIIQGDVHNLQDLRKLLADTQIVINAFGQPVKADPLYSKVTKNVFTLMDDLQIKRYIGVTGGSLTIQQDRKSLLNKIGAILFKIFLSKLLADKQKEWHFLLDHKHIEWTLIRLPFVVDEEETGAIKEHLTDMPGSKITNQDIAAFIIKHVKDQTYIHQAPFIAN